MMDKLINVTGIGFVASVALLLIVLWLLDSVLKEVREVHDHMRTANANISYMKSKLNSMEEKQKQASNNHNKGKKSHTYELKQVNIKPKERTKAEPIDLMTEADIPSFFNRGDR